MSDIEQLADLGVAELKLRLRIVEQVIREAQAVGDARWEALNETQYQPLLQALKVAMVRAGTYPGSVAVEAKMGQVRGKGG